MSEELKGLTVSQIESIMLQTVIDNYDVDIRMTAEAIHNALPPDHTALVRQLVEALEEAVDELVHVQGANTPRGYDIIVRGTRIVSIAKEAGYGQ